MMPRKESKTEKNVTNMDLLSFVEKFLRLMNWLVSPCKNYMRNITAQKRSVQTCSAPPNKAGKGSQILEKNSQRGRSWRTSKPAARWRVVDVVTILFTLLPLWQRMRSTDVILYLFFTQINSAAYSKRALLVWQMSKRVIPGIR